MSEAAAIILAAAAATVVAGGGTGVLRSRLRTAEKARPQYASSSWLPLVGGLGLAGYLTAVAGLWAGLAGACVVIGVVWMRKRRRRVEQAERREADVAEACLTLAAELSSGAPAGSALTAVAADWPDLLGSVAGHGSVGGDISTALRQAATTRGMGALSAMAAAWEVSERTGAGLARVLVAVADSLRAEAAVRREAEAQLATVRSTARLMALLPLGTLLLLSGGDGSAVEFLTSTPYGLACLFGACLFVGAGLAWVSWLSRSAGRSAWGP